ncbi:DUF2955 domain-containing protein [Rhizobiaceae bacterium CRRU44]|uniref:DUF2955 domain-containing protein n=1 Tax=Ferranicluibacter rubi TaxID=2715133 RepID=A0AA43ZH24_9HYPH|nr:DUF2955 domain-containing protein [Ferranicluibacter rubi]NHT77755.1 DUF2955 domain-containing protein [Ferranicluibacter rubi]
MSARDPGREQTRKGLRVALAAAVLFTISVASGAIVPFLGPLFATQFLLASSQPMSLGKVAGMAVLILVVGAIMMMLTTWLGAHPGPFLLLLGLLYLLCFIAQTAGIGGPAVSLILVVAVIVPLLGILNRELAASILTILVGGVLGGAIMMWLAHALIPEPAPEPETSSAQERRTPDYPRALANTAILLASVVICLTSDNLTAAAVIPITVASLLGQIDMAAGSKASVGLMAVNLSGGLLASVGYAVLSLQPSLSTIFVIVLVVGLFLGGRAAALTPDAAMFAGALTIFLILFGLGVSPLPGSAAESFSTRIAFVALAIGYTLLATAVLWRRPQPVLPAL